MHMSSVTPNDDAKVLRVLEQYKSLVSDVGNVGTRYATANGFYLSVLTALLGVLAYVGTGKVIDQTTYPMVLLVAVFAIAICWIWHKTIQFYRKLFRAKFSVLKVLEKHLPVQVYESEDQQVYTDGTKPLTEHEASVPMVLGVFYAVIGVIAVIMFFVELAT